MYPFFTFPACTRNHPFAKGTIIFPEVAPFIQTGACLLWSNQVTFCRVVGQIYKIKSDKSIIFISTK